MMKKFSHSTNRRRARLPPRRSFGSSGVPVGGLPKKPAAKPPPWGPLSL
ncbi:hypothetical protein [Archangium lansingense]|uniref:Uncharacterized protein n=1 Tax=Archangium lansingense TaxID=2995310 RepID=A0ABT4A212_9BACT|nr:hypothetical protein [Archangium lansinium]MCY1075690.1 hypothetical protein [Archangium lansinium]